MRMQGRSSIGLGRFRFDALKSVGDLFGCGYFSADLVKQFRHPFGLPF
jgi:hypothetical protein